jgi:hypothetical protein
MAHFTNEYSPSTSILIGVWEEAWQNRAVQERQAERYRVWLSSQGSSRERAAERAVRMLAKPHKALP